MIAPFSVMDALIGGALLGAGLSVLFILRRQPVGVSGVVTGVVTPAPGDVKWSVVFLGARLANGCASGHGVCGVSRLAPALWLLPAS